MDNKDPLTSRARWKKRLVAILLLIPMAFCGVDFARRQIALSTLAPFGATPKYHGISVVGITFEHGSSFSDDDWSHLQDLADLDDLDLSNSQVSKKTILNVTSFPRLESLRLSVDQLSDEQEDQLLNENPLLVIEKVIRMDDPRFVEQSP